MLDVIFGIGGEQEGESLVLFKEDRGDGLSSSPQS
jgi:hypothetical protein